MICTFSRSHHTLLHTLLHTFLHALFHTLLHTLFHTHTHTLLHHYLDDEMHAKLVAVYRPKIMGSVFGGSSAAEALEMEMDVHNGRPAPTDYCQLPDWLLKFAPNVSGTFAHDEVLLAMRQDDATRDALSAIEDDGILEYIEMLYEASPIRDFERPRELREVDIERPGNHSFFPSLPSQTIFLPLLPSSPSHSCLLHSLLPFPSSRYPRSHHSCHHCCRLGRKNSQQCQTTYHGCFRRFC